MDELHRMFAEALAQSGQADIGEDEIDEIVHRELIPRCVASWLQDLRQRAPDMLLERRGAEDDFRVRHLDRWATGFDLLEMLIVVAEEAGSEINNADRAKSVEDDDAQFQAVVALMLAPS